MPFRYDEPVNFDHSQRTSENEAYEERKEGRRRAGQEDFRRASEEAQKIFDVEFQKISLPIKIQIEYSRKRKSMRCDPLKLSDEMKLTVYFRGNNKVQFYLEYFQHRGGGQTDLTHEISSHEIEFGAEPDSEKLSALATEWIEDIKSKEVPE